MYFYNVYLLFLGKFEGSETETEKSITSIEQKIIGDPVMRTFVNERFEEIQEADPNRMTEHSNTLDMIHANENIPISQWLNGIKLDVENTLKDNDNGNADNVYYNVEFAKHFLRLCKLFPLWSTISCKLFGTPATVSSSANAESYFKDVKHVHADIIPCFADVFAKHHMHRLSQETVKASQTYATFVGPNVKRAKTAKKKHSNKVAEVDENEPDSSVIEVSNEAYQAIESVDTVELCDISATKSISNEQASENEVSCMVCRNGHYPSDAHSCIECGKYVHIFDGCSFSVDGSEGYGSTSNRICVECNARKTKNAQSVKTTEALNTVDSWKKGRNKSSYYLKPNPQFDLINVDKKQCISLLKNGNLFRHPQQLGRKRIVFNNTCTCDAVIQAIAGAYAYHPPYRLFVEKQKGDVFELAKILAKKYVHFLFYILFIDDKDNLTFKSRYGQL